MKNIAPIIFLVLMSMLVTANAADKPRYRGIAIDESSTYFLDVTSIKMRNGALTGWMATEESTPFEGALSTHVLVAVNCQTDEFWLPTSIYYSANGLRGKVVKTVNSGDKAQHRVAPPGSLAQAWIQSVCGLQSKKNPDLVDAIQTAEVSRRAALRYYDDEESASASAIYPNIR